MARFIDLVLAILPFEPAEHLRLGGPRCVYVGHPLIEMTDRLRPSPGERPPLGEGPPTLLVLPGSRNSEIRRLMAPFGEALALVAAGVPGIRAILPTQERLVRRVRETVADWPITCDVVIGEEAKLAAFRSAHAALAASGTVTLELALSGVPTVIAYRMEPMVRPFTGLMTAKHIGLSNLVLDRRAMPEFLDGEATPRRLAGALVPLLRPTPERAAQLTAFEEIDRLMMLPEGTPSSRAADLVIETARAGRR